MKRPAGDNKNDLDTPLVEGQWRWVKFTGWSEWEPVRVEVCDDKGVVFVDGHQVALPPSQYEQIGPIIPLPSDQ